MLLAVGLVVSTHLGLLTLGELLKLIGSILVVRRSSTAELDANRAMVLAPS